MADCFPGTINIDVGQPMLVAAPDHRTPRLKWFVTPPEVFDLLAVELEASVGREPVPAWLYLAHGSPHRKTLHIHELIAPKLDLQGCEQVRLRIRRPCIQLPYKHCPITVVL